MSALKAISIKNIDNVQQNKNINIDTNPINILVPLRKVQNNFDFIFFYIYTAIDKAISF